VPPDLTAPPEQPAHQGILDRPGSRVRLAVLAPAVLVDSPGLLAPKDTPASQEHRASRDLSVTRDRPDFLARLDCLVDLERPAASAQRATKEQLALPATQACQVRHVQSNLIQQ